MRERRRERVIGEGGRERRRERVIGEGVRERRRERVIGEGGRGNAIWERGRQLVG